jgi:beta-ribofuranosylaminobenzene 5'-phosphate synthase
MVRKVVVSTGCRLHFTLIDLNADLGRVDGGIGVALKRPGWRVEVSKTKRWEVDNEANPIVERLRDRIPLKGKYKVKVTTKMPQHVGLGSRTQLSLAIASGLATFQKKTFAVPKLAKHAGRGGTSGIGVAAFEHGGLILDGGHHYREKGGFMPSRYSRAGPPPVLAKYQVPTDWFFVVAIPKGKQYYGTDEAKAFKDHTPIPRKEVGAVARLVLLRLLPAVIENDIEAFGDAIKRIQTLGFKRIENMLQGENIDKLKKYMVRREGIGPGLTSFGPACFCVVKGRKTAEKLAKDLKRYLKARGGGKIFHSQAATSGATIKRS